jgi:hypothetical protein
MPPTTGATSTASVPASLRWDIKPASPQSLDVVAVSAVTHRRALGTVQCTQRVGDVA